jgi:hypothetical protein
MTPLPSGASAMRQLLEPFRRIPSAELYFLEPVRRLRLAGIPAPRPCAIGRHVYAFGESAVVVRYASERDLREIDRRGLRRLIYIADDDFAAAVADPGLPDHYRQRLAAFLRETWPVLTRRADRVLASNAVIAARYGDRATTTIPCWPIPPATLDHFDDDTPLRVALVGGASHAADVASVADELVGAFSRLSDLEIVDFSTSGLSRRLVNGSVRTRQTGWRRHKQVLGSMRCHLALYPLRPTAFNWARSVNKLLEHAVIGAASLVSRFAALDEWPELIDSDCILEVPAATGAWHDKIQTLLGDRSQLRQYAVKGQAAAMRLHANPPAMSFWRDLS